MILTFNTLSADFRPILLNNYCGFYHIIFTISFFTCFFFYFVPAETSSKNNGTTGLKVQAFFEGIKVKFKYPLSFQRNIVYSLSLNHSYTLATQSTLKIHLKN